MFAGPNGSGKTFMVDALLDKIKLGYLINADFVKDELNDSKFLDCTDYLPCTLDQETWKMYVSNPSIQKRIEEHGSPPVLIKENIMVAESSITSYDASIICEIFREILLNFNEDFSFETVMSHKSKVDFIKRAKNKEFKTYLYFICTPDVEINISRVNNRVSKGGHEVPEEKIRKRYYRSLELLFPAFLNSHRAYIIDSTLDEDQMVVVEKDGDSINQNDVTPFWVTKYLLDKLNI